MKALIVEDNKEALYLLEKMLKSMDYQFVSASNGAEALEKLQKEEFNLIISDILMPVMDGFQFCINVKKDNNLKGIPFVFYTATYTEKEDMNLGFKLGVDRYIQKPTKLAEFSKIINGVMEKAGKRKAIPKKPVLEEEKEVFKIYSERLVNKLEKKMLDLQESERNLRVVNRALKTLSNCNQALIRATEESGLLNKMCRVIVDTGGYRLAWVGFAEQDKEKTVRPVAQMGYEEGFLGALDLTWADTEQDRCAAGTAIRTAEIIINRDILTNPDCLPWREQALKRGFASSIALPLIVDEKVLGALNIYAAKPDAFDTGEVKLLTELADDMAFGIMALRTRAERKQAAEELKRSEELLKETGLIAKIGGWEVDIETREVHWTEETYHIHEIPLGHKPPLEEVINFFHPIDRPKLETAIQKAREHGEPYDMELRFITAKGKHLWTYTICKPVTVNGKIVKLTGIFQDITERKQTEKSLRDASEIINRSPAVAFLWKKEEGWPVEYVSENVKELFGYTAKEFLSGKVMYEKTIHPDDLERVMEEVARFSKDKRRKRFAHEPYRIVTKKGQVKWVDDSTFIRRDETGRITHYDGIISDITERKRAEEAIKRSEEQFRTIFRESPLGIALIDSLTGRIYEINRKFAEIAGRTVEEMTKIDWMSITHPDDVQEDLDNMALLNAGKIPGFNMNKRYIRPDGPPVWISMTIAPVSVEDKTHSRHLCMIEDISDRRKAEEALRESEERYRSVAQAAHDAIVTAGSSGKIVTWNLATQKMFGYGENEIVGKPLSIIIPESFKEAHNKGMQRFVSTGKPRVIGKTVELSGLRKNGEEFPIELSLSTWEIEKERFFSAIIRDITERKQAEEQLRKLSRTVEQSPASVVITDTDGNIEYINPKFTRLTGYTLEEVKGKNPRILKSGETSPEEYKHMWETITAGGEWRGEFHNKKKSGKLYWEAASVSPICSEDGAITHFLAVKEDITERKNIEEMLVQSEKMASIGVLAAGIAHEINNPIGFIDSNLNTLERYSRKLTEYMHKTHNLVKAGAEKESFDPRVFIDDFNLLGQKYKIEHILEDLKDAVAESLEGTERVKKIVLDLKDFSRTDKLEFESTDINDVLEKTLNLIWNELKYKAEVIKEFGSLHPIECVPQRLSQVFVNLLVNAAQAIENEGVIRIKTFKSNNSVKVQISDNGKGIPKDHLRLVFDAFFTTKDPGKGTGLGLSISYKIIQDHQGTIDVVSEEGKGTTFTVTLPTKEAVKIERRNIIIVDDDADVRDVLSRMVSVLWPFYSIETAENGFDAGNLLNAFEPDLVLLDINMPGISGLEMCKKIKTSREHREIKVILITGMGGDDLQEKAFTAGADGFLRKPITKEMLKQAIQELM